jgi:iron(III) transport system ATP-binding protein
MTDNGTAALRIEHIVKRFGDFAALNDVSLAINKGELVCFLGPSGCGKTTLLRIIAGLEVQTSGIIVQNGKDISRLPPMMRDYGIVFQSYALFPNLTIYDNVAYGLVNRRLAKTAIRERVTELLNLIGLADSGAKYPGQLSGGQQQRIALARALATSPGLLLLDEPLSALDAQVRVRLRGEIRQLQQRLGVTTILVTHDQEEALSIADRVVVMNQGVIDQVGTPIEIYREPASPFVADFVGKTNMLAAVVRNDAELAIGDVRLQTNGTPVNFRAGTAVTVFLRPEDVVVSSALDPPLPGALAGCIENIEFLGAVCRLGIRVDGIASQLVIADFSPRDMLAFRIERGRPVRVQLPGESIRIFAKSA